MPNTTIGGISLPSDASLFLNGVGGWSVPPGTGGGGGVSIPAGVVTQFAGTAAPSGWLLCDGSAVSRDTYAALFAAIGEKYGAGDGSTTFNLPDARGRVAVGINPADSDFDDVGKTAGAKTHTLTAAEMPAHTHVQDAHGHSVTDPGHTHPQGIRNTGTAGTAGTQGANAANNATAGATGSSQTGLTVQQATAVNQSAGGGGAHNNVQPSLVFSFIIKT